MKDTLDSMLYSYEEKNKKYMFKILKKIENFIVLVDFL
jgi:hypothetical protein